MELRERTGDLGEFVTLLSELGGVLELKVVREDEDAWIGIRVSPQRPAHVLLQQVSKAAVGFGLDIRSIHFGILVD